ncbi:MAG: hypothetical protein MJE66_04850 [Proteobacteria bacterium]|nr:hypothetical protein [Pseudomonadota bacterium]
MEAVSEERRTERLVDELARDLRPVRRTPRLRVAVGAVVLAWVVGGLVLGHWGIAMFPQPLLERDWLHLGLAVALVVAGAGGVVGALASGVPGREKLEHVGLGGLALGLAAGLVMAVGGLAWLGTEPHHSLAMDADCTRKSLALTVVPVFGAGWLLYRSWAARPMMSLWWVLLGGVAMGSVWNHFACNLCGPRHLLLGHVLGPLVVVSLLALVLLPLVRHRLRA